MRYLSNRSSYSSLLSRCVCVCLRVQSSDLCVRFRFGCTTDVSLGARGFVRLWSFAPHPQKKKPRTWDPTSANSAMSRKLKSKMKPAIDVSMATAKKYSDFMDKTQPTSDEQKEFAAEIFQADSRAVTIKAWQFEPDDAQVTSTPLPDAFYHSSPDEQEVWELAVTAGHNLVTATSTLEGDEVVKISAKVMDGSADGF